MSNAYLVLITIDTILTAFGTKHAHDARTGNSVPIRDRSECRSESSRVPRQPHTEYSILESVSSVRDALHLFNFD